MIFFLWIPILVFFTFLHFHSSTRYATLNKNVYVHMYSIVFNITVTFQQIKVCDQRNGIFKIGLNTSAIYFTVYDQFNVTIVSRVNFSPSHKTFFHIFLKKNPECFCVHDNQNVSRRHFWFASHFMTTKLLFVVYLTCHRVLICVLLHWKIYTCFFYVG